jgi:hypothetical protein
MESFLSDLKHSLRTLRQNPSFTITAAAAQPWASEPTRRHFHGHRHGDLAASASSGFGSHSECGPPWKRGRFRTALHLLDAEYPGFEDLAAYHDGASMNLIVGDKPQLVETITASRNYFRLFGAHPALGRTFTAAEDSPGGSC